VIRAAWHNAVMDDPLIIGRGLVIPAAELAWRFSPSGGPGGQHANRTASRAEVVFDLGASPSIDDEMRRRMLDRLGARAPGGVVTVAVDESRSQWRNRAIARKRLIALLQDATRQRRRRRPTRPTRAARDRRLRAKRRRGETKRLRRPPEPE
jgi:ribosome-associated protein